MSKKRKRRHIPSLFKYLAEVQRIDKRLDALDDKYREMRSVLNRRRDFYALLAYNSFLSELSFMHDDMTQLLDEEARADDEEDVDN